MSLQCSQVMFLKGSVLYSAIVMESMWGMQWEDKDQCQSPYFTEVWAAGCSKTPYSSFSHGPSHTAQVEMEKWWGLSYFWYELDRESMLFFKTEIMGISSRG